jgi:hypothetical protein
MAKAEKPAHALNHGGNKRATNAKRKPGKVGLVNEKENMTALRWQTVIESFANGSDNAGAAKAANISVRTIDAFLISNVAATIQLRDAKLLWSRRDWPMDRIDSVLEQIALGKTIRQAFDHCGIAREHIATLYRILLKDKAVRKLYDEARELQAESYSDDIIDIADANENDRDEDGKINHEVINRDRLRVDSRKWLSGKWAPRRFGDTKHHMHEGDININHAAILSGGRKRLEALNAKRSGTTIDSVTQEEVVTNE